jgi:hypothetical protein
MARPLMIGLIALGSASVLSGSVFEAVGSRAAQPPAQCERRAGPFLSRDAALRARQDALAGPGRLSSVFRCAAEGSSGHCFNAILPC